MRALLKEKITITLASGKKVSTEARLFGVYEHNHGADADGNRGMGVWFLDDYEYDAQETCDDEKPLTEDEQKEFDALILSYIENGDFDFNDCNDEDY